MDDGAVGLCHSLPYAGTTGSGSKGVISVPFNRDTPSEVLRV
jgi:hypothetical protein